MSLPLAGCYVISLRPVGAHASLRRAAARAGARLLALSPWRVQAQDDDATRADLEAALASSHVLFTSPAAVRAAVTLRPLHAAAGTHWWAVGAGTAAALRRAGIDAIAPNRMDSEGLLALPGLQRLAGCTVGLVTAPGGREQIAPTLRQRGAQLRRADAYRRIALPPSARAMAALHALSAPAWLALSSGAALDTLLPALPRDAAATLLRADVVAASERLAQLAHARGFRGRIVVAASARPADLVAAAARAHPVACPQPRLPEPP